MKKIVNYSGIPGLILMAVLVFLPFSCSKVAVKENPDADNSSQLIKISGEDASAATKTTLELLATKWKVGDQVGVYCAQSTGGKDNIPYTALSAAVSSSFSGAMKWSATNPHVFYAYYPYAGAAGSPAAGLVPIDLHAAQSQSEGGNSDHIGALDFMVATPVTDATPGTAGEATTVNLRYNHVFSILEFQIIKATGTISEIKLSGNGPLSLTSGTIDITQATPANAATPYTILSPVYGSEITLTTAAVTTTADYGTTPKIYMMVLPKSITGYLNIAIKIGNTYKFIQKVVPTGGFDRGQKYVVLIDAETATDYPGTTLASVVIGSTTWAPVNAGYDAAHKYGLMYQWGRKYGQNYWNDGIGSTTVSGPVAISVGNNPANAANFYTSAAEPYDWCTPQVASWATDYSPCPAGWRLPTTAELTALLNPGSTQGNGGPDNLYGRWFGPTSGSPTPDKNIFLPAAGQLTNIGLSYNRNNNYGYYWSSEVSGVQASYLNFELSGPVMYPGKRVSGVSARCVR